ncbi:MAG TPA: type II toxin-antitoxin system VapC family toxin [Rhizomicrobium sp.]|jgi:tRNA(fMet)-specific endonuclease VapC|nr:type II toxin-antitoxin system VapC family toxin [Rhizomicrobium sp.]
MAGRYILDTNICIYIRSRRLPHIRARFERLEPGEAALSVITYGELLYGAEKTANRASAMRQLEELATAIPVLSLPDSAAESYGAIRAELEKKGHMIGNNDLWIAAHVRAAGLTLVTNNEREFRRVPGLKIENWAKA